MATIYGIHQGSVYEGGSMLSPLYTDKSQAVAAMMVVVIEKKEKHKEMFKKAAPEHYKEFNWRKDEAFEDRWHNTVDEIQLVEMELV